MDYTAYPEGLTKIMENYDFVPEEEREDMIWGQIFLLLSEIGE